MRSKSQGEAERRNGEGAESRATFGSGSRSVPESEVPFICDDKVGGVSFRLASGKRQV